MATEPSGVQAAPKNNRAGVWASRVIIALVTLAVLAGGAWYWRFHQLYAETEDAYVGAHVVQISSQVSGPAIAVPVVNNLFVRKGALLFEIDPAPFRIAVERARAQLALAQQNTGGASAEVQAARAQVAQMQAQLQNAISNTRRTEALEADKFLSRQAGEDALTQRRTAAAALRAAQAKLAQAESNLGASNTSQIRLAQANLAQAELNLSYTRVYAPADGYVTNLTLRPGTMVNAGQPQFAFVENGDYWVDANFKETDFEHIRPGQHAKVVVDMYPNHPFKGVVESLSSGSGAAFSLLPPQNATGNWVKVTQRVPVRVHILNPDLRYPLRIGTSATVTVDLHSR